MSAVDISILGDKELSRKLGKLVDRAQKKIVRAALRKGAKRTQKQIVANIQQENLIDDGVMLNAYSSAKIRSSSRNRRVIRLGVENPKRSELGIRADDKYYYPYAVEFGHSGAKAHPFIRPAIDEHEASLKRAIGRDIGTAIEREARR